MASSPRHGRAPRRTQGQRSGAVHVDRDGAVTTLLVTGHLDVEVGEALLAEARTAAAAARRVDIDLQAVESFTSDGAVALGTCRQLAGDLDDGLHYRTGQGAGMAALLEGCGDTGTAMGPP